MGFTIGMLVSIFFWFAIVMLLVRLARDGSLKLGNRRYRGIHLRGSMGRQWNRDDYHRLSEADEQRQQIPPPTLDDLTAELEDVLKDEEDCAGQLREAIDKRRTLAAALQTSAAEWRERASLAVSKDRDDLARKALVEAHQCEDGIAQCEGAIEELQPILESYETEIDELHRKLNEGLNRRLVAEARIERAELGVRAERMLKGEAAADLGQAHRVTERQADEKEGEWEAGRLGSGSHPALEHRREIDREIAVMKQAIADEPDAPKS